MDIRKLTDAMFVAPQISVGDVAEAAQSGIRLIINNRPDDESPDQTPGAEIAAAAAQHGMAYAAIPVTHAGFSQPQVEAMAQALDSADGLVLAYCRSGTRSTNLWALARASQGDSPGVLTALAADAGYDLTPIRPLLDMLKGQA